MRLKRSATKHAEPGRTPTRFSSAPRNLQILSQPMQSIWHRPHYLVHPPVFSALSARSRRPHHARHQALRLGGQHGGRSLRHVRRGRRTAGGAFARPVGSRPRIGESRVSWGAGAREKRERPRQGREAAGGRFGARFRAEARRWVLPGVMCVLFQRCATC